MKARRFCSVLALCFCLILSKPFSVLADITTGSNAVMTMDLSDDDYSVMPMSSLASITNTVDYSSITLYVRLIDNESGSYVFNYPNIIDSSGNFRYYVPSGYTLDSYGFQFKNAALPPSGKYRLRLDYASDVSVSYKAFDFATYKKINNATTLNKFVSVKPYCSYSSGDLYLDFILEYSSMSHAVFITYLSDELSEGSLVAGQLKVNFSVSSDEADITGVSTGSTDVQDYQNDVSSSLSDLSSSVGSMTEDLSSAAESLEYISTSQNLIIQGIDNVIMHISDQLYAFWDQLYNLIHEPTYAKLEEILAALRAIANNSDIYAVVEEVRESNQKEMANDTANTDKQIANDNANTDKVTDAVEKHGNFIIDGLKSLFIPSDDYFSSLFDDLNVFFKDRFGFLYTPIDLLVRFIDLIYGSDAEFTGIPFPELKWDGYVLLEAQTVGFDILEVEEFKNVQNILYFLTNLAMIGALIALIHKKFEEVMRN